MARTLVTFSGIDCCGKSTQIQLLEDVLRERDQRPVRLWIRGGYTPRLAEARALARRMLGKRAAPPGETTQRQAFMKNRAKRRLWLYLAIADLFVECVVRVRWLRLLGHSVICDRYLVDSEIDFSLNFAEDNVPQWRSWRLLCKLAANPDHAFLLDLPFEESARRSREKKEPFPEKDELRRLRADCYVARRDARAWHVLDGYRSIEQLHREITGVVSGAAARRATEAA
jgi:thymidylate kinase